MLNQLRKRGIQVKRMPPLLSQRPDMILDVTLERLVAHHLLVPDPDFYVVQIGAFDGRTQDPLHDLIMRYGWAGVLVEPQARFFQALCSTYADQPRLTIRNVAVGERDEVRPFYRVKEGPTIPKWAAQLASFDPTTILRHDDGRIRLEENLVCEQVQCVCFESLLADTEHVDLLQIDAEGYDGTLIRLFDFEHWHPSIVQFEHKHLSLWEHDAAMQRLVEHGYRVAAGPIDTVAYRNGGRQLPRAGQAPR
jgi:FkbM family methyltransferase